MARRRGVEPALRVVVGILRPFMMLLTRRRWSGAEHLPPEGVGVVVAPNHLSDIDPLTSGHYLWDHRRTPRFLGKESLFRLPVVGRLISACGQIPVHRDSRDASRSLAAAVAAVRDGECVVIYPEGTLTKDPDLWPMTGKSGAARVALETGCDVLPMGQWGPQQIIAPVTKRIRPFPRTTVQVRVGPPVDLDDLRGVPITPAVLREGTDRIMAAVTAEVGALRGEVPPTERFDLRRGR